ncbi:MAG: hypothetical protein Q9210_005222 [Variospora velana]
MDRQTATPPIPADPPGISRSSSDSVVVGSRKDMASSGLHEGRNIQPDDVAVQTIRQGTLVVAMRACSPSRLPTMGSKPRHQLQLPSFRALGIANPFPASIPTPPDEPTSLNWTPADTGSSYITTPPSITSVPVIVQSSGTPETPLPGGLILTASNDTPTQGVVGSWGSPAVTSAQSHSSGSSNSSTATETASNMPWLDGAISAIVPHVSSASNTTSVVTVLYHPQPCPLSRAILGAPSALTGIINALQTRFGQFSSDRYIDVTHAVPAKFSFSQLPNSPVTTPNRPAAEASMGDYFSIPSTVVFAKGAIAASHESRKNLVAQNAASTPFPQTVVAPSSIAISVLERFIPPATVSEYSDLFKIDQPSALVDRMVELKPDHGDLVFIYPTQTGAIAFREAYLGPILDPQLRTLNGVHGISTNVLADIARLEPIRAMHNFYQLRLKVAQLLASMNRKGGGNLHRFTISEASTQHVHIGRDAWAEWFTEQELPRIREIMNQYYGRAHRLPRTEGAGDYTAAGLVREIVDGIKGRAYEAGEAPREGIEVGVFVIKRIR